MMVQGNCSKCGSKDQRYWDHDGKFNFAALRCLQCGQIAQYEDRRGNVVATVPMPPESGTSVVPDERRWRRLEEKVSIADPLTPRLREVYERTMPNSLP